MMKKHAVSAPVLVLFTFSLLLTIGFYVVVSPTLKEFTRHLAESEVYTSVEGQQVKSTPKSSSTKTEELGQKTLLLLPEENNLYDLSVQIEALSKSVPLTLTALNLTPGAPAGSKTTSKTAQQGKRPLPAGVIASSVSVTVAGSYENVQAFIFALSTLERLVTVQDVTLSSSAGIVTAQITASTYSLPSSNAR